MAERYQLAAAVRLRKILVALYAIVATGTVSAGVDGVIRVTDLDPPAAPLSTGANGFDQRLVGQWVTVSPWWETREVGASQKAGADRHFAHVDHRRMYCHISPTGAVLMCQFEISPDSSPKSIGNFQPLQLRTFEWESVHFAVLGIIDPSSPPSISAPVISHHLLAYRIVDEQNRCVLRWSYCFSDLERVNGHFSGWEQGVTLSTLLDQLILALAGFEAGPHERVVAWSKLREQLPSLLPRWKETCLKALDTPQQERGMGFVRVAPTLPEEVRSQVEEIRKRLVGEVKRQEEVRREMRNHEAEKVFLAKSQTTYLLLLDGKTDAAVSRLEDFAAKHADTPAGAEAREILNRLKGGRLEDARLRLCALIDQQLKSRTKS